jgi:outer membrane lipase/esterase
MRKHIPSLVLFAAAVGAAGCGGTDASPLSPKPIAPSFGRVIAFGDSLTDQGNYKAVAQSLGVEGAGRFTTNPDLMWVEHTAAYFNLAIKARAEGGTNYAEGFARNTLPAPPQPGLSQTPVAEQVSRFLAADKFGAKDLVLINGGGNDVLIAALTNAGTAPLDVAATDFASVIGKLKAAGAVHVYVLRTPDIGVAPVGGSGAGGDQNPLTQLVGHYNAKVVQEISRANLAVRYIDTYSFIRDLFYNPARYGLSDVKTPGCSNGDFASFACPRSQQVPAASSQYLMADKIHLAGKAQQLMGQFVAASIAQSE